MSDTDIKLTSIYEWTRWVKGLRSQALDVEVWDNINPEATPQGPVPWLDMPTDDNDGPWTYYERQETNRKLVFTWICNHLSDSLLHLCYDTISADPAVWYITLVKHLNITKNTILALLEKEFDGAMTSMSSRPREASKLPGWIEKWLETMIECRTAGLSSTLNVLIWLYKLFKNIDNVLPCWSPAFISANVVAIDTGVLTFETVASNLRLQITTLADTNFVLTKSDNENRPVNSRRQRSRGVNRGCRGHGRSRRRLQWQQLQRPPAHS